MVTSIDPPSDVTLTSHLFLHRREKYWEYEYEEVRVDFRGLPAFLPSPPS